MTSDRGDPFGRLPDKGQGSDHRHTHGQLPPFTSMGYRSHHPGFSETEIPLRGNLHSLVGIKPGTASSLHREMSARSSAKLVKHKIPKLQPTPFAMPPTTRRGRSLKQDPDDIIDLTLDNSDFEFFNTPEEPPSAKISSDLQSVWRSPDVPTHPLSEETSSDSSIRGFSTGSAILDPVLNLVKEPHDKPRLFVRYVLDFKSCLVNISAHGSVDQVRVAPRR